MFNDHKISGYWPKPADTIAAILGSTIKDYIRQHIQSCTSKYIIIKILSKN